MHDPTLRLLLDACDHAPDGQVAELVAPAAASALHRLRRAGTIPGVTLAPSPYLSFLARSGGQRGATAPLAASA